MPLSLAVETEREQLVVWDPDDLEQTKEALFKVTALEADGFTVEELSLSDGRVQLTPPSLDEHHLLMRILSQNGDDRIVWDRRIPAQVKEAFKKFKELMKKGYTAYATMLNGSRGHKITEFDPGLEEVLLTAKEITMVPRTVPG